MNSIFMTIGDLSALGPGATRRFGAAPARLGIKPRPLIEETALPANPRAVAGMAGLGPT
jgi:hypothetical protein